MSAESEDRVGDDDTTYSTYVMREELPSLKDLWYVFFFNSRVRL